jgi:hypothetical protein
MALGLFIGIFTYLLPAIVLYFAVRLIMQAYLKNGERKREAEINSVRNQMVLPLKLQACERLILLLERITPSQAVNRAIQPGMTSYELQIMLLKNIREEYEHNVAQQLYVSPSCWALIKTAKEEVIRLVNISAAESEDGSIAGVMAKNLLVHWSELENDPIQSAIKQIKIESQLL